nr:hypothetical protein CFP56_15800 [Quercus suber]
MDEGVESNEEEDSLYEGMVAISLSKEEKVRIREPWGQAIIVKILPGVPIEFYDLLILRKIGQAIGLVLRIDSHTANGERGRFARLCVQVNIDKPLVNSIMIGKVFQLVQYESINMLCFACGHMGHRKEFCPDVIRKPTPCLAKNDMAFTSPSTSGL